MRAKQITSGVALAIACLAATPSARAQTAPGAPQIYDAAGLLVGIALSADQFGRGRVLLNLGADQAVAHIDRQGFLVGGPTVPLAAAVAPASSADGVFFATPDCQGAAYVPVSSFPDDGLFIPDGSPEAGRTQAGTVIYAARPYSTVDLHGFKAVDGACSALPQKVKSLVGVAKQMRLSSYKLPFVTK